MSCFITFYYFINFYLICFSFTISNKRFNILYCFVESFTFYSINVFLYCRNMMSQFIYQRN